MKNHECRNIGKLVIRLGKARIKQETMDKIMEGSENILRMSSPKNKADWMLEA